MAADNYGLAYFHGITGTLTNAIVKSFSKKTTRAKQNTLEGQDGIVVERRYDDTTVEADMTIAFAPAYTIPAAGSQLTFDSVIYIIQDVGESYTAGEFAEVSLSLITSEGITLA